MAQSELLISTPETDNTAGRRYSLLVARDDAEVRAAQRLRHLVFAQEMGARLHSPVDGLDIDGFDEFCDHLVVRDETTGDIVGTYRMLPPTEPHSSTPTASSISPPSRPPPRARRDGSVVRAPGPPHRRGRQPRVGRHRPLHAAVRPFLAGRLRVPVVVRRRRHGRRRVGCGARQALRTTEYRVTPRRPWDVDYTERPARTVVPPLLRGYLRLGAWVCGRPAFDPDFGVADLFVLLSLDRVTSVTCGSS